MEYNAYIQREVDLKHLFSDKPARNNWVEELVPSVAKLLLHHRILVDLEDGQDNLPFIDVESVRRVDIEGIVEAMQKEGIIDMYVAYPEDNEYYIFAMKDEELIMEFDILNFFEERGLHISLELVEMPVESGDETVLTPIYEVTGVSATEPIEGKDTFIEKVGREEIEDILSDIQLTQKNGTLTWIERDMGLQFINEFYLEKEIGSLRFYDTVMTLSQVLKIDILRGLERMKENGRKTIYSHDIIPSIIYDCLPENNGEREIVNERNFNDYISSISSIVGIENILIDDDCWDKINRYAVLLSENAQKRASREGRKYVKPFDF